MRSKWLILLGLILATLVVGNFQNQGPSIDEAPQKASGNVIAESQLPSEARETLDLIDSGGPFSYRQDGGVFGNREGLLPKQETGYYREYTVETPGEGDRGARRLVVGSDGDAYYTSDHYASFKRVERSK